MTINRSNMTTTADGADIFVVGPAQSPFTNFGNLTTSGNLASSIRVAANEVSVTNKGALSTSGDGSPGITIGDIFGQHYDDVTVANYGSISTTGNTFDNGVALAFPDGISSYGNNNSLMNYGSITVTSSDGAGLDSIGSNCLLANYGSISAAGAGLAANAIDGSETGNTLVNFGQIHTTADGNFGIVCFSADSVVKNYGTIQADGILSFGIGLLEADNHGENYGTILATGELGRGVLLSNGDSFDNYGIIRTTGANSVGARFSGDNLPGSDGGAFTNFGKIMSTGWSVRGSASDDHFVNHGSLSGNADMGGGDDTFVAGNGGSLSGTLTLGDGNDLIVFEKGGGSLIVTDFVAGAGTDDVIDLSAFGFTSLADLMAHASQLGSDVMLKLGAKDHIVLDNVSLGSLSADDFAFASAALQHATAPAAVPHGDYLFA
jgi:hypothetical protein